MRVVIQATGLVSGSQKSGSNNTKEVITVVRWVVIVMVEKYSIYKRKMEAQTCKDANLTMEQKGICEDPGNSEKWPLGLSSLALYCW